MIRSTARFEKVSLKEFIKSCENIFGNIDLDLVKKAYDNIKIPQRSTQKSAGYDFYMPFDVSVEPNCYVCIPTGIRCINMLDDEVLNMYARSGLGSKNGFVPRNLVGIIDADYSEAKNEGHILMMMINNGDESVLLKNGKAFCQGILQNFSITANDNQSEKQTRTGGFGSTDKS